MDKNIYNIELTDLTYGRGYVYSLQYHIVWCTKYRKQILRNGVDTELKEMLQQLAAEYQFRIMAMEVMPDHVHLLLDCRPQFRISDMVKILKGNTARWLFIKRPELKASLWGGHLWNPSYCAVTVSDRSREQVTRYSLPECCCLPDHCLRQCVGGTGSCRKREAPLQYRGASRAQHKEECRPV